MNITLQESVNDIICANKSINKANIDIFGTMAMYVVTIVGTPSYTSGDQKWNGAALTLNRNPTKRIIKPKSMKRGSYHIKSSVI